MSARMQVVVPYPVANATVRARAIHWLERLAVESGCSVDDVAAVRGPGFDGQVRPAALPTLVVRNVGRFSRGRGEQRLLRAGAPGVYDLDDGLPWDDGNLPGLGHWWKRPWPRSLIARRAAEAADRVVVGNEVLASWAADHCRDVRIVPTCIEPDDYLRRTDHGVGSVPRIGWVGSPATEGYLVDIAPALAEVHRRTGARLTMISGAGAVPVPLAPFTDKVVWSEAVVLHDVASFDVGIMPLRDGVYERAKCAYKLLQYGAAAVPVVASPVGVNQRLVTEMSGLPATSHDDWIDVLCAVLAEPDSARAARGASARQVAEAHAYAVWEQRWRDAMGLA